MRYFETETYDEMARKAANLLSAQIISHPDSVMGLATGSTPEGIYRYLADWYRKGDLDFSLVRTVNLDEYLGLGPGDEQSYHTYMEKHLFSLVNLKKENCSVPDGLAADPESACREYDEHIRALGGIDMQLLGIGHDGHIGFNEPDEVFEKNTHLVSLAPSTIEANARFFSTPEQVPAKALTMGMVSIMQARKIVLVAAGEGKRDILRRSFEGPITPRVPASILQLHPDITVVFARKA